MMLAVLAPSCHLFQYQNQSAAVAQARPVENENAIPEINDNWFKEYESRNYLLPISGVLAVAYVSRCQVEIFA